MQPNKLLKALVLCTMLLFFHHSYSQNKEISGRVTDPRDGSGIGGVSVAAKGSAAGTQTNADGYYRLSVPSSVTTLVFSSIGYTAQEIALDGSSAVNVGLAINNTSLGEIVVVAYGTRRKGDLTGAVTSVTAKDFQKGNITSSEQLLQGKVPGLQITSGGGAAGGGSKIRIRGGASLNATNDPLIVIDGVPVESNGVSGSANLLNTINPDDIESISVLKDASATALYGSRASNGVLIITTKKGVRGKLKFNYNMLLSSSDIVKNVDVLTADQIRATVTADAVATGNNTYKNLLGRANTNWQDEVYRLAFGTTHNVSMSGSIKNILPIRLSLGYNTQEGLIQTNKFDRYTVGLNLNPKLLDDHLSINIAAKATQTHNTFVDEGRVIGSAVSFDPTQPVFGGSKFGGYYEWLQADGNPIDLATRNPLALIYQRHNTARVNRIVGNVQVDYKLHFFPDLHLQANIGIDNAYGSGNNNVDSTAATDYKTGGRKQFYKQNKKNMLADVSLFYSKDIKSINSKVDVLAGHSYQAFETDVFNYAAFSYRAIADPTKPAKKDTIPGSEQNNATDKPEYRIESYLARINYTYNDRYLLTASIRRDAVSRFAPDNRVSYFPAVALAWKMREEFFSNSHIVSDLKLRVSWGKTGQQDVGSNLYSYLPFYSQSNTSAQYQFGNTFYSFLRPGAYDRSRKWETTETANIGLDFGFLNNRISGSVDVYKRKTKDLLSVIPVAPGSNFDISLLTNVGNMESKGVEFVLNTTPVKGRNVVWDFGFNISYNKFDITNLLKYKDPSFTGIPVSGISGGTGNNIGKFAVGYAPFTYFLYKQVYDAQNGRPIEGLYEDINRDGKTDDADRVLTKKPAPDVLLGINTQISVKQFTLGFAGHGSFGSYLYNNFRSNNGTLRTIKNPQIFIGNASTDYYNNTQFTNNQYLSDYYLENASYFRLDNINFGYNAGHVLGNGTNMRVSASVQNVFVITKYKGLDPENSSDTGVDNNIYPRPRIISLGVNVDF